MWLRLNDLQHPGDTFVRWTAENVYGPLTSGVHTVNEICNRLVCNCAHVWSVSMESVGRPGHVDVAPKDKIRRIEIRTRLCPQAAVVEIHLRVNGGHGRRGIANDPRIGIDCLCSLDGRVLRGHDRGLLVAQGRTAAGVNECAQRFGNDYTMKCNAEIRGQGGFAGAFAAEDGNCGHTSFFPAPKDASPGAVRDDVEVPSQRSDITMDSGEVGAFLGAAQTIVLCTIGPDGVPDPVPMWFVVEGDVLWMRTYAKSQKVRNIERDSRVSLLAETGDRYVELRGVQLTGPLEVSTDVDRICTVFAELMVKYEGLDRQFIADTMTAYRQTAQKQVALACRWTDPAWRIVSWDHRKQGGN
jgi:PPOX class probable F420-dependent enzyme